jgi:hypothetical protein
VSLDLTTRRLLANVEPVVFWQLLQWQSTVPRGEPVTVYLVDPQRQEPVIVVVVGVGAGLDITKESSSTWNNGLVSVIDCSQQVSDSGATNESIRYQYCRAKDLMRGA